MAGKLIVGILNIRSSFKQDCDTQATAAEADTIQWWVERGMAWRIRTFAIDDEIHVDFAGVDFVGPGTTGSLVRHIQKNYGEFLSEIKILDFPDRRDEAATAAIFNRAGLTPHFVQAPQGFAFWHPTA